jgi:hypothetical protein
MFVACGNSGYGYTGAGGSYNNPGGNGYMIVHLASNLMCCAGGGGGWGASGGSGGGTTQPSVYHPGGPGGKAVSLNGASITVFNSGVVAGAIS